VTSYVEGKDAEEAITQYAEDVQFQIGVEAGMEIRKVHQLAAPSHMERWATRKAEKHQRYIDAYHECGIRIPYDTDIIAFIDNNIHLMNDRPNVLQHDDFHVANIIVKDGKFAGIIDFDRYDWGDPVHEFLKVGMFSKGVSIPFAVGQIKGYFLNDEPDDAFWRLYALYLAMSVFSAIVWTINTTPDTLDDMLDKVNAFVRDHDHFQQVRPIWYDSYNYKEKRV